MLEPRNPFETEPEQASSPLQDAVLALLEDAGIDAATNDQIIKLIMEAENDRLADVQQDYQDRLHER
jgi:hypothetical protein